VTTPTVLTIGTHNLHDESGRPTPFADVVLFTEAVEDRLLSWIDRARGYDLIVCREQPDLAIAYRRRLFKPEAGEYRRAHAGVAGVTPHRGTFAVDGELLGHDATLIVEHRINAAFPPYVRGESVFRRTCWATHTDLTLGVIRNRKRAGHLVIAGGDDNTPRSERGLLAYRGELQEVGHHFDRLAVSHKGARLYGATYLGRVGSDHPRLRATLEIQ
jgi:hypothetical protein